LVDKWSVGSHRSRVKKRKKRNRRVPIIAAATTVMVVVAAFVVYYYEFRPQPKTVDTVQSKTGTNLGQQLPNFAFTLLDGTNSSLANYYNPDNHTILLWLVTTWSSYCQDGLKSLSSSYYSQLNAKGVTVLVVELYNNLGKPGPTLAQVASQYGGGTDKPGVYYGTMNENVTYMIDPGIDIDAFYLLNSNGTIITLGYGSPAYDFILTKV